MTIKTTAANLSGCLDNFKQFYSHVLPVATDDPNIYEIHLDRPKDTRKAAPITAPGDNMKLSAGKLSHLTALESKLVGTN